MVSRKAKTSNVTDIRIQQKWQIQPNENNMENYVCVGWEIQVKRGNDQWIPIEVDNVVVDQNGEMPNV